MEDMSSEERVRATLQHRDPDRVPLDGWFGLQEIEALKRVFKVNDHPSVREKLGIDFHYLYMRASEDFRRRGGEKHSYMMWFDAISLGGGLYQDEWGIVYTLGTTGDFYHYVKHPLQGVRSLKGYDFPDIDAPGRFEEAGELMEGLRDRLVAIAWGGAPLLFNKAWTLRGYREFIRDLYTNPDFVEELLDRLTEYAIKTSKRFVDMGAWIIGFADDVGVQRGMMIHPTLWRRFIKPRFEKIIREVKGYGAEYIFYHSDGDIRAIIPDLIGIGVDILNPIQPECMDPREIKEKYGAQLTLHGSISMQETLPFSSPEDVKKEVMERIRDCAKGGGFCLAPSNRTTPDIPLENILTLYKTAREYRGMDD